MDLEELYQENENILAYKRDLRQGLLKMITKYYLVYTKGSLYDFFLEEKMAIDSIPKKRSQSFMIKQVDDPTFLKLFL